MRTLAWFSCGAASAVAAKLTVEKFPKAEILYCDTLKYEHPDNARFLNDVSKWIGKEIKILKSKKYEDIFHVFEETGWLVGPGGARCTTELKKNVRRDYQLPDDTHVFGFTSDEKKRIDRFNEEQPDLKSWFPLYEQGISKSNCFSILQNAGITLPAMYLLGYPNNNCVGCVKGQAGYWNKIRKDFPEAFERMSRVERNMGVAINKKYVGKKRVRIFLDELPPDMGRIIDEPDIECGVLCVNDKPSDPGDSKGTVDMSREKQTSTEAGE